MTMLAHSQYAATALAETNLVDGDEDFSLESAHASYLGALGLVERLHRLQLDLIKDEFERLGRGDINSVQALLVFNIADEELTAGELKTLGDRSTVGAQSLDREGTGGAPRRGRAAHPSPDGNGVGRHRVARRPRAASAVHAAAGELLAQPDPVHLLAADQRLSSSFKIGAPR